MRFKTVEVVLVLFALTLCAGFLWGKVSEGQFMTAALLVLGFFYQSKAAEDREVAVAAARNQIG